MEKKMVDYSKIVKEILVTQRKGGDDFDIVENVSLSLEIPRNRAREVYNMVKTKEQANG
jgi:hypothetical protein